MSTIYYHMKEPDVTVLGPGHRYVLWVQGCGRSCPGCISPESHDKKAGKPIEAAALAWEIALSGAEGLTISGGEPFLQPEALAELVKELRALRPDMGLIVYTGFTLEQLRQMPQAGAFLDQIDLLIDGPYIRELNDGRGLRGSSNQRILPLTDKYRALAEHWDTLPRQQQTFPHGIEIHRAGLPDGSGTYHNS